MYDVFKSDENLFNNSMTFFIETNDLKHILEALEKKHFYEAQDKIDISTKKNDLLIWNAIYCREVINKGISKSYLHTIYNKFYDMILNCSKLEQLQNTEIQLVSSYLNVLINDMEVTENFMINKMLQYLHLHIEEHVSVERIAHDLNISEGYACSCFKKNMGISLMKYAKKIKIDRAKKLLITTNKSMLELSVILGFYDQSHFTKTFKSFVGLSPTEYRNKNYFQ